MTKDQITAAAAIVEILRILPTPADAVEVLASLQYNFWIEYGNKENTIDQMLEDYCKSMKSIYMASLDA